MGESCFFQFCSLQSGYVSFILMLCYLVLSHLFSHWSLAILTADLRTNRAQHSRFCDHWAVGLSMFERDAQRRQSAEAAS